ncbi:hypothetical protein BB560_007100, partial [Smittium megazygosporum]
MDKRKNFSTDFDKLVDLSDLGSSQGSAKQNKPIFSQIGYFSINNTIPKNGSTQSNQQSPNPFTQSTSFNTSNAPKSNLSLFSINNNATPYEPKKPTPDPFADLTINNFLDTLNPTPQKSSSSSVSPDPIQKTEKQSAQNNQKVDLDTWNFDPLLSSSSFVSSKSKTPTVTQETNIFDPLATINPSKPDTSKSPEQKIPSFSQTPDPDFFFSWNDSNENQEPLSTTLPVSRQAQKQSEKSDYNLSYIIQKGYSIDQAKTALEISNDNIQDALLLLQQQEQILSTRGFSGALDRSENQSQVNTKPKQSNPDSFAQKTMSSAERIFNVPSSSNTSSLLKNASTWLESTFSSLNINKTQSSRPLFQNGSSRRNKNVSPNSHVDYTDQPYFKDSSSDSSDEEFSFDQKTARTQSQIQAPYTRSYITETNYLKDPKIRSQSPSSNLTFSSGISEYDFNSKNPTPKIEKSADLVDTEDLLFIDSTSSSRPSKSTVSSLSSAAHSYQSSPNPSLHQRTTVKSNISLSKQETAIKIPEISLSLFENILSQKKSANDAFKLGQYELALEKYSACIDQLPECSSFPENMHPYASLLLNNRAACYMKSGDLKSCISDSLLSSKISICFLTPSAQKNAFTLHSETLDFLNLHTKSLFRISSAYENLEKYQLALDSFNKLSALPIDQQSRHLVSE